MKTRNVHRGGTTHCVDRLTSKKARAALALAVSLWIATGGVASAGQTTTVETNHTGEVNGNHNGDNLGDRTGDPNGNTVTVNEGVKVTEDVRGGFYFNKDGNVTNNIVTINGTVIKAVYGGESDRGYDVMGNQVTVTGTVGANVYGGYTGGGSGTATGNSVTVNGGTISMNVYGGYSTQGSATGNTVTLNDAKITLDVYGGDNLSGTGERVTGNTLNLSGVNSAQSIGNFDTVNIKSAVWGTPALKLTGNIGTVNNINTDGITFSGIDAVNAADETPLIQGGMTDYAGTITGTTYKVGSTLQGKGHAERDGANLKFIADTTAENMTAREQTHNTVMGASVSMTALSMGNEFVGAATEGLAAPANVGADGVSSFAQMGGGSMWQETGSHVDTHTWNAILALGHQNKKERGTMEYGAFFEYGTGNYTTHADNGLRGDGSARYTGGGLLAKYTMKNSVYVEGSLRAGSVHDDARNVLSDGFGNPYSYDTNAAYMGFHLGVGREIAVAGGNAVDVYGKYFYNRRNGVSFDAGGHYDLDAVTSSVLRVGARYILKRNKWNFYAGAAYEHEFDGKANGTADGMAIRGADTSGGSFRGELGATVKPGENSPWNIDLNVSGFAGKKQGFTGGVSVAFIF